MYKPVYKKTLNLNSNCSVYVLGKWSIYLLIIIEQNPLLARYDFIQWPLFGIAFLFFFYILYKIQIKRNYKAIHWIAIYFFIVLLSLLWTYSFSATIKDALYLFKIMIIITSLLYIVRQEKSIDSIVNCIIIGTVINEAIMLPYIVELGSIDYRESIVISGVLFGANMVGPNIAFATLFVLMRLINSKRYKIGIILFIVNIFFVLKLGSRSSLLIIFIGCILIVLTSETSKKIKYLVLGGAFLALGIVVVFSSATLYNTIGRRIIDSVGFLKGSADLNSVNVKSDELRLLLLRNGREMFAKKPLLGYGSGSFSEVNMSYYDNNYYSHNNYLECLVGVGIVGTIIYYYIYLYILCFSVSKKTLNSKRYYYFGKILVICMLIYEFFSVTYNVLSLIIVIMLGYACTVMNKDVLFDTLETK